MRFRRRIGLVLLVLAASMFLIRVAFHFARMRYVPYPIRVLSSDHDGLVTYARNVLSGKVHKRSEYEGYSLPMALVRKGITLVRIDEGCVVFYFESLPPDPIDELVYSEDAHQSVAAFLDARAHSLLLRIYMIDQHWFYVRRI